MYISASVQQLLLAFSSELNNEGSFQGRILVRWTFSVMNDGQTQPSVYSWYNLYVLMPFLCPCLLLWWARWDFKLFVSLALSQFIYMKCQHYCLVIVHIFLVVPWTVLLSICSQFSYYCWVSNCLKEEEKWIFKLTLNFQKIIGRTVST